jgi:type IV pilus assembly protein PilA
MKRDETDSGFTLVELMVVVLIIAILVAIAIPTFLGQRRSAQDQRAQSNLRNAHTVLKVYWTFNEEFTSSVTELAAIEPSLFQINGTDAGDDPVLVTVEAGPSPQAVCLTTYADSGRWYSVYERADAGALFGATAADPFASCTAAEAAAFQPSAKVAWAW